MGVVAAEVMRLRCASRASRGAYVPAYADGSMMQVGWKAPRHRHSPVRGEPGRGEGSRKIARIRRRFLLLINGFGTTTEDSAPRKSVDEMVQPIRRL